MHPIFAIEFMEIRPLCVLSQLISIVPRKSPALPCRSIVEDFWWMGGKPTLPPPTRGHGSGFFSFNLEPRRGGGGLGVGFSTKHQKFWELPLDGQPLGPKAKSRFSKGLILTTGVCYKHCRIPVGQGPPRGLFKGNIGPSRFWAGGESAKWA